MVSSWTAHIKLRSHMRGAVAGGFWYSRSATAGMFTHTRSGRGRICHFLRTMMVWSVRFRSGCGKLGVGPISCGAVFAPVPPPLRDRACVNACNDLCWSQFSARPRPRMCERTSRDPDSSLRPHMFSGINTLYLVLLACNTARPSVGTMLTNKLDMLIFFEIFL